MLRRLIIIFFISFLTSCEINTEFNETILYNSKGDTLCVIRTLLSGETFEKVFYQEGRFFRNAGFSKSGDSLTQPELIQLNENKFYAYIPFDQRNISVDLMFGLDSIEFVDPKLQAIQSKFREENAKLVRSRVISVPSLFIKNDTVKGVFRMRNSNDSNWTYIYYPFIKRAK
ncbi:MAG: hypothetical protein JNK73_13680 [Bacteroidia bacterium]|nr:hypothetical protein [Bacteroidia bacterium]